MLGLFCHEFLNEYRSATKSWYSVLRTIVGRSKRERSRERVTWPAAWKDRMAMGQRSRKLVMRGSILVLPDENSPAIKGLLETRFADTIAAGMTIKMVWMEKERMKMRRRREYGCR